MSFTLRKYNLKVVTIVNFIKYCKVTEHLKKGEEKTEKWVNEE